MKFDRLFAPLLDTEKEYSVRRNYFILWFSILLAAVFLYLALRDLEWGTFFSTLGEAKVGYLPIFMLWASLSYGIRAFRWKILLNAERLLTTRLVFMANMAGYLGNTILPARAGELVRAAYVAKPSGIRSSFALATGLVERLMDVIALVLLGSLFIILMGLFSSTLQAGLEVMGFISVAGLAIIFLLPRSAGRVEALLKKLPWFEDRFREKLQASMRSFLLGLSSLGNGKRIIVFSQLTALVWFMDAAGMVFLARILSLSLTFSQAVVLLAALGLSSALPSTPGYVGVYQFAAILVLKPFGFSNANAVALVLFAQIMNVLIIGIWGSVALAQFSKITQEQGREPQNPNRSAY